MNYLSSTINRKLGLLANNSKFDNKISLLVDCDIIRGYSKSTFVVQGRVLKKRTKTNRGRGVQAYLYVRSVKKIA